jgi:DNA-binding MurR/RpiR family transcriptional regulator
MFRDRIKESYESLTPSFKDLADFILSHELEVAFMTATELAQTLEVDAATVVRFSQALGYSGYRELSHEIQRIVKEDLTAVYASFSEVETPVEQLQAVLENERHNLETAISQVTDKASEILAMLAEAGKVWVVSDGMGRHLAGLFADQLRMVGVDAAALVADLGAVAHVAGEWGADDLVVGIGATGTGVDTAAVLRFAQKKGASTAAVSVSAVSPTAQAVDHLLVCPSNSPVALPSIGSLVTMLVGLSQALFAQKGEMGERAEQLQEAYGALVAAWGAEAEKVDAPKLWKEF